MLVEAKRHIHSTARVRDTILRTGTVVERASERSMTVDLQKTMN